MKNLFIAGLLLFVIPAGAATYECGLIDDFDSWSLQIKLKGQMNEAIFFDNDHNSVLKMTSMRSLETSPPQRVLVFSGADSMDSQRKLRVSFNLTKLTADLTDDLGGRYQKVFKFKCR